MALQNGFTEVFANLVGKGVDKEVKDKVSHHGSQIEVHVGLP